jgi:hypothetical protein
MLDDCISLLVHIVLPVLDKTGLQDDLRTPRLLRELKEYRILIGEYSKVSKGTVPDGWEGQEGLNSNFNDDLEREVILNDSWYLDTAAPVSSPFSPVSPATNVNLNAMEWGTNGDVFLNALALTQVPPSGWADVIEHMRFRLEMLVDDYEKGSVVSLHGASALGVCDRNAEVDLVVAIPSLSESSSVLLTERAELKKAISSLLPPHIESITAAQFVLGTLQRYVSHIYRLIFLFDTSSLSFFISFLHPFPHSLLSPSLSPLRLPLLLSTLSHSIPSLLIPGTLQECVSTTRGTISEHVSKVKKNPVEARLLSKLNADSELICKIGDRMNETSQKNLDTQKNENAQFMVSSVESKKLKVTLSTCEKNLTSARESMMGVVGGMVPHIGYHIVHSSEQYGTFLKRCHVM